MSPEILSFEVQGIPHVIAVNNLGSVDRTTFVADLKRVAETAVAIIGEIPYRHYTFLIVRVTSRTLAETLNARKPGDTVRVLLSRRSAIREFDVVLGKRTERSFRITPLPNPTPLQTAVLEGWLKGQ